MKIDLNNIYNEKSIELKNKYTLSIVFNKNNNNFKNILYKKIFNSNITHVNFILDDKYKIDTSFEDGTKLEILEKDIDLLDLIYFDNDYNKLTKIVKINITKEEYISILNLFNNINNKKYDYYSIFKNIFNNKLEKKEKLICTEVAELILNLIDIKINNRYKIDNLYNNLISKLRNNKKIFILI